MYRADRSMIRTRGQWLSCLASGRVSLDLPQRQMYRIVHYRQVQVQFTVHEALHRPLLRDRVLLLILVLCHLLRMEVHGGLRVVVF